MESISNRALSAIERREGPDSLAVQEIIEDWITFFARLAGEKPTPEFVRGFAEEVPAWLENDCNNKLQ